MTSLILKDNHPFLLLSQKLAELCKPLELINIIHFTYTKKYYNGHRYSLSNKPQWISDYYNLNLYKSSLFEEDPKSYTSGFNVWIGDYDLQVYKHGKQYYNTSHSITITEPQNDGCEFYFFATTQNNYAAISYLTNNIDILYRFILYLKDQGADLFNKADKFKLPFKGNDICNTSPQIFQHDELIYQQMGSATKQFLLKTPVRKYLLGDSFEGNIKLSRQEIEIIKNLLRDHAISEIAQNMNITIRTAQYYIENIKIKMSCNTKLELLLKLKSNKYLASLR